MTKRLFALLAVVCILCSMLCACQPKKEITSEEAVQIVMNDLGDKAENAGEPHVHNGTFENVACYDIYVTVDGLPFVYVISTEGEILHKGFGNHSH
jgi:hypothetical protein